MPSPTTIEEFLDLVRKSGVVDDKRLVGHLSQLRAAGEIPADPTQLAQALVRDGVLTQFQAEQLLQGKWRRFSIGKYRVLERLGTGGMGSVYLCEHTLMRRRVALKVLPTAKADDPAALERFYREARAVAAVDHPNIVRAYDIDREDKIHFLVMEHVDGSSLQEIVKKNGPMDVLRACHYIRQAALGLQHAHESAGLVHRDIKPGNLLVDRSGTVKVLDMGLARFFHDKDDGLSQKYDENVLGTADYLAPEQAIDSHAADIRADIYSLGATFYYLLTGQTPFGEGTVAQKLIWHQTRQPRALKSLRPEVPDGLADLVERMMAKDPAQRFATPLEVAEALSPWTQSPIPPPPDDEMPQLSAATGTSSENQATGGRAAAGEASPRPRPVWQTPSSGGPKSPVARPSAAPTPAAPKARGSAPRPRKAAPSAPPAPAFTPPAPAMRREPGGVRAQAITAAPPAPAAEEAVTWGALGDTADGVKRQNTPSSARRASPGSRRRLPSTPAATDRRYLWWIIGGSAAGVCVLVVLLLCLVFRSSPENSATTGETLIYVNKSGENGAAKTLEDALKRAKQQQSGAVRILLQNDIAELGRISSPNITIESDGDRAVTWKPPAQVGGSVKTLILIYNAENFHLRGVTLDGDNRMEILVNMAGNCAGTSLKDLKLRGFTRNGLECTNCNGGTVDRRVVLSNLTFQTGKANQTGLYFDHRDNLQFPPNYMIVVRNASMEGPGTRIAAKSEQACVKGNVDLGPGLDAKIQKPRPVIPGAGGGPPR
jgi:serine/threonine protein kinase